MAWALLYALAMRWVRAMVAASSLVAMTLSAGEAAADNANRWSVTARAGMLNSSEVWGSLGLMAGLELQWHASEHLRAGGYLAAHRFWNETDGAYYEGGQFTGGRGGLRGEWHFRPSAIIDPWVGAAAGAFRNSDRRRSILNGQETIGGAGLDVSGDGGVDLHIGSHFIVGALVSATIPLSNWDSAGGVSTSAIGWTFSPQLRLGASF